MVRADGRGKVDRSTSRMKYDILTATERGFWDTIDALVEKVNEHIKVDWKPQGGVSVVYEGEYYAACQVMVRED